MQWLAFMTKVVIGIVQTVRQAETLVSQLKASGCVTKDISVLIPNASAEVTSGGCVDGAIGMLAGLGTLAVPGLGLVIAAGPIMSTLGGATAFGIAGVLMGLGIPETEARIYEGRIRDGHLLIAVHTRDRAMRARADKICKSNGAHDVSTMREATSPRND